jgi:hypothetical protein
MQRKLSHLHTHFTIRKSNFEAIATKLMAVTPDVLMHLANHLEHNDTLAGV